MRISAAILLSSAALTGCQESHPPVAIDRQGKLLTMAAAEAQQIADSKQRLSRQLNFANEQLRRAKPGEAKQSLAFAAQTLRDAKPRDLDPQLRIAGWVSISELSRAADDKPAAQAACDQAVTVLKTLDPVSDRPQYVVGVSDEVKALQGSAAAAALLESSVEWIKQMPGASVNRYALVAVAGGDFQLRRFHRWTRRPARRHRRRLALGHAGDCSPSRSTQTGSNRRLSHRPRPQTTPVSGMLMATSFPTRWTHHVHSTGFPTSATPPYREARQAIAHRRLPLAAAADSANPSIFALCFSKRDEPSGVV